ncbi:MULTISPECIES: AMP-binding protein [unclassified Dietzia]|uniref:AMP-binding protein n=1 Tax=unclassified Dietzia TaxID=2617939 RepID=UPI0015FAE759|nr:MULTISPECIES: AMP-binding protein [unclassified Dietzia]MBB1022936.1 AMP-binding protein [Dietzia sp. DQ12-76]MBB1029210.1 AMP-binding protein [Dietzia sp. DQ11-38-2]
MRPTRLPDDRSVAAFRAAGHWQDRPLDHYLDRAARLWGERTAVVDGDRRVSFSEVNRDAMRLAAALIERGVRSGDVVSFQLPNCAEAVVVYHALHRIGAVVNPIVPIYREREVTFIATQARSRVAIIPGVHRGFDYAEMYRGLAPDLPDLELVITTDSDRREGVETLASLLDSVTDDQVDRVHALPSPDPDDVCLLLYTSGTTADPKGALHSHNTLVFENRSMIDTFGLTAQDVIFNPSPVTHITGVNCALTLPFLLGAPVVLQDVWDSQKALRQIRTERASFMIFATPFLRGLLDAARDSGLETPSIRYIICGGADIPDALVTEADERLGTITRMYGATEGPSVTSANLADGPELRKYSDGRVLAPTEVVVADEAGRAVETGQVGEVLWRGPDTFLGYLDAALNHDAFTEAGFFRTGDLARVDERGGIHIVGRIKDIINRSGEKISTHDVENQLSEHPLVVEVAVVAGPDPVTGERGCAFVVTRGRADLSLEEVRQFLVDRGVAVQKVPESVFVVDALPKTASGKIQKFALRDFTRDRSTAPEQMAATSLVAVHER